MIASIIDAGLAPQGITCGGSIFTTGEHRDNPEMMLYGRRMEHGVVGRICGIEAQTETFRHSLRFARCSNTK
jgi:hypothetical protein